MNNENLTFFNLNHHFCRHRNDGLYDFVLFVQYAKQEIPQRAVKQRKFWRFNVVVVYCNLLFLLLLGPFGIPFGGLAHLTKNSPKFLVFFRGPWGGQL